MTVHQTEFEGLYIIEPKVFSDQRGYFFESYNTRNFEEHIEGINFVQDNEAKSSRGVLRGLHYQLPPYAQSKLVRVIKGTVLDVAVDIRKDSKTYGKHYTIVLSEENKLQLFVPRGFAHGYIVLSTEAIFTYKCDNYYSSEHERIIIYNDENLNIDWLIDTNDIILSKKDLNAQPMDKRIR